MEFLLKNSGLFWFIGGIVLMMIEFIIPHFIMFFFGIGAVVTAVLSWAGIINSFEIQIAVFIGVSLVTLILLRRLLQNYFTGRKSSTSLDGSIRDDIIGKRAIVIEEINAEKLTGKIEIHGTQWRASSEDMIANGESVEIVGRKDLTLLVKK